MEKQHGLGQWLSNRCQKEHLSLRQAAVRIGLSHATLAQVIKSDRASPETIRKLAMGFGGDGINERFALEDHLLMLGGFRTPRPEGDEPSELLARLMDKVRQFGEPQLKIMWDFADLLAEIDERGKSQ